MLQTLAHFVLLATNNFQVKYQQTIDTGLVNWKLHWFLPTYNPLDCRCGQGNVTKGHFTSGSLVEPQMQELLEAFGTVPELDAGAHPIDYILNYLPRSDVDLTRGKSKHVWPAQLRGVYVPTDGFSKLQKKVGYNVVPRNRSWPPSQTEIYKVLRTVLTTFRIQRMKIIGSRRCT